MASLPKIEEDKNFIQKKRINKCESYREIKRNILDVKYQFNKQKFFNSQSKDVDLKTVDCLNMSKNISKKDKEFLRNKEKNEKKFHNSLDFEVKPDNNKK